MQELKIAAIFGAILTAAAAIVMTMGSLLLQFRTPGDQVMAWRSLVIALGGVGIALCLICLLHLSLATGGLVVRTSEARRVKAWLARWAAVANGDAAPAVPSRERYAAAEAAALIMQDMSGEGARRIRTALEASGLVARDIAQAGSGRGLAQLQRVAALERLAWLAAPEALPLFHRAAGGPDPRAARAGLLGACRTLATVERPGAIGYQVLDCIEAHAARVSRASGYRPFLAASLAGAGRHVGWLCAELLSRPLPEPVRAAALDALGVARPDGAAEVVAEALAAGLEGETLAAALRALARLGPVPDVALGAVAAACDDAFDGARVQAAYALVGAAHHVAAARLWTLLGDPAFDVRFAAATALSGWGAVGAETLRRAAATHPDAFARDMASMIDSLNVASAADAPRRGRQPFAMSASRPPVPAEA